MNLKPCNGKRILITGGTGSLGKTLVRRLMSQELGKPAKIIVFSRDETKQHFMRLDFQQRAAATDEIIYHNFQKLLEFRIGDVRDYASVASVLRDVDIVFNAAAMKQVPTCEYFPYEAVLTNIQGAENMVRAIQEHTLMVETVIGISTDKACKPVNTMGITKAVQERIFIQGNMRCPGTRFVCVRYGNVLASRGSVIPLFHDQIAHGGPLTVTTTDMTRFLLSLDDAVDTVFAALMEGQAGEIYVPRAPAARVVDIAQALIDGRDIKTTITGIRPGEKTHEIMVSDEEAPRAQERGRWYALLPMLPEICGERTGSGCLTKEYSSNDTVMNLAETTALLKKNRLMFEDVAVPAPNMFSGYQGRETLR
jgi:FlaA1/EpsC-like NDP-sugar epimerase